MWFGSIDHRSAALQLILILDYLADWARKLYRKGIAASLQKLVTHGSTQSLERDSTEVRSIVEYERSNSIEQSREGLNENISEVHLWYQSMIETIEKETYGRIERHRQLKRLQEL